MIQHFTQSQYDNSNYKSKLELECEYCHNIFLVSKKTIIDVQRTNQRKKARFCSKECHNLFQSKKISTACSNCGNPIKLQSHRYKKSLNHFCSRSCSVTYHNTYKIKGYRRSKLEIYLEKELKILYPELKMDFNQTDTINSELDIYIPSLKLAFELNGIFHYEPIYGEIKLSQIKNNDNRKIQACIERNIEFCIIDISHQKYFKEQTSKEFLNIITAIIDNKKIVLGSIVEMPFPD
jgi:hypothetical protein